jgi:hypothetical protein
MGDLYDRVTAEQDIFKKLLSKVPGFNGYIERENRRSSDKVMRGAIADRYESLWQRISGLQRDLISQGGLEYVDDLESAAIKLRQFIERVRTATYGYSGFFDAVKINETELGQVYQFDLNLLNMAEEVGRGIDNVETSIGTDGLPAAIRNLITLAQQVVEAYNHRTEAMIGGVDTKSQ